MIPYGLPLLYLRILNFAITAYKEKCFSYCHTNL